MTINLHDITGQESGIILVETDDGRHMNVVANWGAKGGRRLRLLRILPLEKKEKRKC